MALDWNLDWNTVAGTMRRGSAPITRRAAAAGRRVANWRSRPGRAIELARWHLAAGQVDRASAAASRAWPSITGRDFLIGLLDHRGEVERALAMCVDNAAQHIQQLRRRRPRPARLRELGPDQRVFLSGFFKSGSSAVLDYLRGFEGVARWAPAGELRLIKSVGGMTRLATGYAEHARLTPQDLVAFYLHLTGTKHTTSARGSYDKWRIVNRNSADLFRRRAAAGYLQACLECFLVPAERAGQPWPGGVPALEQCLRTYVQRALDAAATDTRADMLLLDQRVNAWRLPISRFASPSTFVIVHRDPRDQFVDARAALRQPGRVEPSAAEFAASYRRRRRKAGRDVAEIARAYQHRSVQIGFEDFVHDPATAHELVDFLGLAGRRYRQGRFEVARARAAVGKHTRQLTPEESAVIAAALPEYLDARAGRVLPSQEPHQETQRVCSSQEV